MAVPYKLSYLEIETGLSPASTFKHTGDFLANRIIKYAGTSDDILLGDGSTTSLADLLTLDSLSASSPLSYNNLTGAFSIAQASASTSGYLSSTDWNTFNNKQPAGNYVTLDTAQTIIGAKTFNATITSNRINATATGDGAAVISAFAFDNSVAGSFRSNTTLAQNSPTLFVQQNGTGDMARFQSSTDQISIESDGDVYGVRNLTLRESIKKITGSSIYTYDLPNANGTIALISDLGNYVTLDTAQTITGQKTFTSDILANAITLDPTPATIPTAQGSMYFDNDNQTIAAILNGSTMKIGEDSFYQIKNQSGATIPKGTALRFDGVVGSSGRVKAVPFLANGTYPSIYFLGVAYEDILDGADGKALAFGSVRGVNTNAYAAGTVLYASTTVAGGYQTTAPTAPNNIIVVAAVTTQGVSNGQLLVRPLIGSNINNDEGVLINTPIAGDLLQLQSDGLWKNKSVASLNLVPQSRTLTINGTGYDLTADRSWSVGTITSLTGEATASGSGAVSVTLDNNSVTGKVLTGLNITGGTVVSTDSILAAFGKVQNELNGLIGGSVYQGTWNASTNTPTLTSSVGTRGHYYIVSVAGTTNLNGVTDWQIGDWAIFDGAAWQKVDNTDAVVTVNGYSGAVSLVTGDVLEGAGTLPGRPSQLYFTDARSRSALSFAAGSGAYDSSTGVITIPTNTNQLTNGASFITLASLSGTAPIQYNTGTGAISITQSGASSDGYLSSTDWNTFNNKVSTATLANYVDLNTNQTITGSKTFDISPSLGTTPTISTALKVLVKDPSTGKISEQLLSFSKVVYFNNTTPTSATIFSLDNPPIINDNSLKLLDTAIYIGTDSSTWVSNGVTYSTYTPSSTGSGTPFFIQGTNIDAGSNKTSIISRNADVVSNGVRIGRGAGNILTNTVIGGGGALNSNTTGDNNVALGEYALGSNTTGTSNFGMGFASLGANTVGSFNVGLGRASLRWSTGNYNVGIGMQSLSASGMTSSNNVAIGWLSGGQTTTGGSNVSIGAGSGGQTTGSRNIAIGTDAKVITNTADGQINIGNSLFAIGATSNSNASPLGSWGIGVSNPSEKLHVDGRLRLNTIDNGTGDFATISASGVITRRTAVQALSDIGAQPLGNYVTTDTTQSITGAKTFTNGIILGTTGVDAYTISADGLAKSKFNFNGKSFIFDASAIPALATLTYTMPSTTGTIALTSDIHNPVTIGTANGLSLSGQVLSLGLASSINAGALSASDYIAFSSKQPAGNYVTLDTDQTITSNKTFQRPILIDGDTSTQFNYLGFKQASAGSFGKNGYTSIYPVLNSGLSFAFSQGSNIYKSFIFDVGLLPNNSTRSYQMPNANGTVMLGSGTTSYIPKFTNANTIGNSQIFETASGININSTIDAGYKLDVNGTMRVAGAATFSSSVQTGGNLIIRTGGYPLIDLGVSPTNYFRIVYDNPNGTLVLSKDGGSSLLSINSTGAATFSSSVTAQNATFKNSGSSPNNTVLIQTSDYVLSSAGSVLRLGHVATTGDTTAIIQNLTSGGTATGNISFQEGNVLIGTTTDNGAKLRVTGNTHSEGLYIATGQFQQSGGATSTFYTFPNVNTNKVFMITVRQSGNGANNVTAMAYTYGGGLAAYNLGQDNTNPVLFLTISSSGLGITFTTASGYGSTTWEYTITQIK